jgi:hypothetical protein
MSEKIPQSSPENNERKTYLIPRSDGSFDEIYVTGKKEEYRLILQRDGSTETMKLLEVQRTDGVNADGESVPQAEMVAEYLLSEDVQKGLIQQQQNVITNDKKEHYE